MFRPIDPRASFPKLEEDTLKYWKENKIFEKSLEKSPKDKTWTLLDGPPFITGTPHYGSLLSSLPKDLFGRYWTMKGYRVRRVWGWDGHGLPIENKVEEKLGIKRKRDIEEKVGVKKFIEECKKYVNVVSREWEWYVDRIGRWVDFENAYKTWDLSYMESVMWVFKQMHDKGYIYKGLRVSLYCPHCSTPISNFEVAMDRDNYKEVTETATTYKYQLANVKDTFLLAWSTTPWNKIVTPALAVNPKLVYLKVKQGGEFYILAKSTVKMLTDKKYEVLEEFNGKELVGKKFVPHYDFYEIDKEKKAFIVVGGDFVTADEGTGVVTLAAYGEEDFEVMKKENIQIVQHVDDEGIIKDFVPKFGGMFYLDSNKAVNEDLSNKGLIYREDNYTHKVAMCWRCHTRLFYNPQNAWYVNVQKLKDKMKKTNKNVNWYPEHFKNGRYLKSLEAAPDWNISRSRYWGSPVPVWECEKCQERFVPGSIKELEEASGSTVADLHKPEIDEIKIVCKKCGKISKRVPEVLDSWIESGSAAFAERHFPFDKKEKLDEFFPPDFIAEYTGQIRAWFYVLHVISTALYDLPAFKNVVVEGVILGTDGRKMSKNYGNYPDPKEMIEKYGGDALRMYLLGSPVMNGEDIRISEVDYRDQIRGTLLILWNVYNFFVTYANQDKWSPGESLESTNALDKWILSRLNNLVKNITQELENFNTVGAISKYKKFVDELSTWYIRRSRDRVGVSSGNREDRDSFYNTCYEVLITLTKLTAPITPFVSESIFKNLTSEESVHLEDWPEVQEAMIDKELEEEMRSAAELASSINAFRKENLVSVKFPFKKMEYSGPMEFSPEILDIVKEEVNVYKLVYKDKKDKYSILGDSSEKNQDIEAGRARDIIRKIQQERKRIGASLDERVEAYIKEWPEKYEEEIKRKALVKTLTKSEEFKVIKSNA